MAHPLSFDEFRQFTRDIAGAVIAEQSGAARHRRAVAARTTQREVQHDGGGLGPHVDARIQGDDVAPEDVKHGLQRAAASTPKFVKAAIGFANSSIPEDEKQAWRRRSSCFLQPDSLPPSAENVT